ncbi:hypothetical protein HK096_001926 [Nowakowskiella sp. JEL0078]|nr:hypothetical protein HK096_001926 [Nowakowskiella sp. JEL0078]
MTTFSDKAFDSKAYSSFRPTYSSILYDTIRDFHNEGFDFNISVWINILFLDESASFDRAVDVGSGTGQATFDLAESLKFKKVIGVEPRFPAAIAHENIQYLNGSSSNLPVEDSSIDLVTSAQAAHWFDFPKFISEVKRVLKPGGTLAVWGYGFVYFPDYPEASKILKEFGEIDMVT